MLEPSINLLCQPTWAKSLHSVNSMVSHHVLIDGTRVPKNNI
ncbi:hypothetical protein THTE_2753 [Thermogutta terrifontis]|uniref:Uncharacterized protein n=1 Tax=Thermogutta terrifontis TaxID=1331910 RepID=A0A286RHA4_9BACT|nr:hypothetical protein THTE_2753 [Thermogutta terrifontis]